MDLINDERVVWQDVAILKPAARNSGGHNDDVQAREFGRGLALTVHDSHLERRPKDLLRDGADGECLPGARAGYDAEPLTTSCQLAHARSMRAFQVGVEVQANRDLDCLAGGARRRDHDDAASR